MYHQREESYEVSLRYSWFVNWYKTYTILSLQGVAAFVQCLCLLSLKWKPPTLHTHTSPALSTLWYEFEAASLCEWFSGGTFALCNGVCVVCHLAGRERHGGPAFGNKLGHVHTAQGLTLRWDVIYGKCCLIRGQWHRWLLGVLCLNVYMIMYVVIIT